MMNPRGYEHVKHQLGKTRRNQSAQGDPVLYSHRQYGRDHRRSRSPGCQAASASGAASCTTPRSAIANTQYGKVRGYLDDGVLTFKGVPYGANTGGENRWLPAKPPHALGQ